jgi:hypothetical protein
MSKIRPRLSSAVVLGTNPKPARYALRESSVEAALAPLALVQLLPEGRRPSPILALSPRALEIFASTVAGEAAELVGESNDVRDDRV